MKREAFHGRKTLGIARRLKAMGFESSRAVARGILEGIYYLTATAAPHGDIGRLHDDEIAEVCDWEREPAELVKLLVEARVLDESKEHRLLTHDWAEHADKHVHRSVVRSLSPFADGSIPRVSEGTTQERVAWYRKFPKSAPLDRSSESGDPGGDPGGIPAGPQKGTGGAPTGSEPVTSNQLRDLEDHTSGEQTSAREPEDLTEATPPKEHCDDQAPESSSRRRRKRDRPEPPPEAVRFAENFRSAVAAVNPGRAPPSAQTFNGRWCDEARLLLAQRGEQEAQEIARWLFRGTGDGADFWRGQIFCTETFRAKFDKLVHARRRDERVATRAQSGGGGRVVGALARYRERKERREMAGQSAG